MNNETSVDIKNAGRADTRKTISAVVENPVTIETNSTVGFDTEIARYRSGMYSLAAHVFAQEPSAEQLINMIDAAICANPDATTYHYEARLLDYLRSLQTYDPDDLRTRIAERYAELFIGPRPPLAPLYESMYIGYPQRLNTDVTAKVREFYECNGMTVLRRNRIPDDHLAFELEFMTYLCNAEASASENNDVDAAMAAKHTQIAFLHKHLGQWARLFAERVRASELADDESPAYYSAWADFVCGLVDEDSMVSWQ